MIYDLNNLKKAPVSQIIVLYFSGYFKTYAITNISELELGI